MFRSAKYIFCKSSSPVIITLREVFKEIYNIVVFICNLLTQQFRLFKWSEGFFAVSDIIKNTRVREQEKTNARMTMVWLSHTQVVWTDGCSSERVSKSFKRLDVFNKRVSKSFERLDVFIERVSKSFERMDAFTKRVSKSFERLDVSIERVIKPFERMQIFLNEWPRSFERMQISFKRVLNGIPFENGKPL